MIKLKISNNKTLELIQISNENIQRETSVSIEYPSILENSPETPIDLFLNSSVSQSKRLYKSTNPSLTILFTRYLNIKEGRHARIDTSLNLFSYQYLRKLNDLFYDFKSDKDKQKFESIMSLISEINNLLSSFRKLKFKNKKNIFKFEKIDFLISFETEQFLLKITSLLQKEAGTKRLCAELLSSAIRENEYRVEKKYHLNDGSFHLTKDSEHKLVRILNRVEMRKKIIELPLNVSERVTNYEKIAKYISLALSTGFIMTVIGFFMLQIKTFGLNTTYALVIGLSLLYIIRDLFKAEIKDMIYTGVMKIMPNLKKKFYIQGRKGNLGYSKIWISKVKKQFIPKNKSNEHCLIVLKELLVFYNFKHYEFKKIKTSTKLNISYIMEAIKKEDRLLYIYNKDQNAAKECILPRQYKIKLIVQSKTILKKLKIDRPPIIEFSEYSVLIDKEHIIKITLKTTKEGE